MIKWDKEKTVLSVAGGIASLVLGYLIWRHEQSVEGQNAAAQLAAQQNIANEQAQEVQQELESIPSYEGGGGTTDDGSDADSTTSSLETPPTDSTLESILQAFYGTSGTGSTSSAGGTTVTPNDPTAPTVGAGENASPTAPGILINERVGQAAQNQNMPVAPGTDALSTIATGVQKASYGAM